MAGGQQITILQGNVGALAGGNISLQLTGQQITASAGNVSSEYVFENTFATAIAGIAKATFGVPLVAKQSKP